LDITRCFLLDRDLPGSLWAEAIRAAYIILNLRSTKRSPGKTPSELFSGIKPNISNLRIFGSTVFVYDTKPRKRKLDSRSRKCLYLSTNDRTKGFRCYDVMTRRVLVSKDVKFIEDSPPTEIFSEPADLTDLPTIVIPEDSTPLETSSTLVTPAGLVPTYSHEAQDSILGSSLPSEPPATTTQCQDPSSPAPVPPVQSILLDQPVAPALPLRRSTRIKLPPRSHDDYNKMDLARFFIGILEEGGETLRYNDAIRDSRWLKAMEVEFISLLKNDTWTLVPAPLGIRPITAR
jgi:hypothetical protein